MCLSVSLAGSHTDASSCSINLAGPVSLRARKAASSILNGSLWAVDILRTHHHHQSALGRPEEPLALLGRDLLPAALWGLKLAGIASATHILNSRNGDLSPIEQSNFGCYSKLNDNHLD